MMPHSLAVQKLTDPMDYIKNSPENVLIEN